MEPSSLARTPEPPYYVVIFTSLRTDVEAAEYGATADHMVALAATMPGFLGVESARDAAGVGITVSYWSSLEAIERWKKHAQHAVAQRMGKERWYRAYELRIARVERAYGFSREHGAAGRDRST